MAEGPSRVDDNQRDKPAKKKATPAGQAGADNADASTEAPSRVYIFKGKPSPDAPPKSGAESLQCAGFRKGRPIESANQIVQAHPPIIGLKQGLKRLQQGIETGKKAMYEAAMKVEDLNGILQGLQQTRYILSKRRRYRRILTGQ